MREEKNFSSQNQGGKVNHGVCKSSKFAQNGIKIFCFTYYSVDNEKSDVEYNCNLFQEKPHHLNILSMIILTES